MCETLSDAVEMFGTSLNCTFMGNLVFLLMGPWDGDDGGDGDEEVVAFVGIGVLKQELWEVAERSSGWLGGENKGKEGNKMRHEMDVRERRLSSKEKPAALRPSVPKK